MTITDRLGRTVDGTDSSARPADPNAGLAIKSPCRAATTVNITLSGLQTIDGITLADAERVLVKNQTDATLNGIYNASSGNWTRAVDWDGAHEIARGTQVLVTGGTANALRTYSITSADPLSIGTSSVAITELAPGPELAALAALATTGLMVRAGVTSYTTRSIAGTTNEITVANGSGVSGDPTVSLPNAITLSGKTITGGTFSGITLTASDSALTLQDNVDPTKQLQFQLSGISTATTRTLTIPNASGTLALTSNKLSAFAATTSAELASVLSDETGSTSGGVAVFNNGPTLIAPVLGTPASATLTNATGLPIATGVSGLGTGVATFLAAPSSANLLAAVTDETGTGPLVFGTGPTITAATITLAADPATALGAATKQYVDSLAAGLDVKPSVVCATTANITLSGEQTLDGILTSASRVLVKNQSTASQNGIYVSAAGSWTRATDMDAWAEVPGSFVFVEQGTLYADTAWVSTANAGGTIGSTSIAWSQFAGAGTYTAGTGLILTGTQFLIDSTVVTLTGAQALTNKTYNGNTWTAGTGVLTLGAGKTATVSNTLTFTGTDSSSVAFGTGGTVAYVANKLSVFAATTSAELAGVLSDETGSSGGGVAVFSNAPALTSPTVTTQATSDNSTKAASTAFAQSLKIANIATISRSSNTILAAANYDTLIRATSTFTQTLTAAATLGDGWRIWYRNSGAGIITFDPNSSETIDGFTTLNIYPGEECLITCDGTSFYTVGLAGRVILETKTLSGVATADFLNFDNNRFSRYEFQVSNMYPATNTDALWVRTTSNAGSSYNSGASDYAHNRVQGVTLTSAGTDSKIVLCGSVDNTFTRGASLIIEMTTPSGPANILTHGRFLDGGAAEQILQSAGFTPAAVNGLRFLFSSGNISSGAIRQIGLR